ncbi:MAG: 2-hydroxyacyl-CoA dehydratase [Desulfatitalea sp.]|nr:2-hydroxyacyl-CoA dehydratase family protein [Desulfatitalea sp.]NNK01196.1 2-hydroxyacyl-CoA dehydratase [Desulfatitalea sp.]
MNTQTEQTDIRPSALEELLTLPLRGENPYILDWKANGGKVFAYVCSYVPEEIIYAVKGVAKSRYLPVRLGAAGCNNTEDADIDLSRCLCSFARSTLQMGLDGAYSYLDGLVFSSSCEQMRRSFEFWRDKRHPDFLAMISVPRTTDTNAHFEWYLEEINNVRTKFGQKYGLLSSKAALNETIAIYNRFRELMLTIYALRLGDAPKLTGTQALKIAQAGFNMPKEIFNTKLEAAIEEIMQRPGITDYRARVLLAGSPVDDPALVEIIEGTGALVVTDALCTGRKFIEGMVDEGSDDPVRAIAKRYFSKETCPRMMDGTDSRVAYVKRLAKEANVDGVIFQYITFCDNHNIENIIESRALEKEGIPTLTLEREYQPKDVGRLRTRVQAFMERINK